MAAIIRTLWDLSEKLGISERADTIEEQVNLINNAVGSKMGNNIEEAIRQYAADAPTYDITDVTDPTVAAMAQSASVFEVSVSKLQDDDITIADGAITGTLKYLDEDDAITAVWGEGHFMALQFSSFPAGTDACWVGLCPSVSSGLADVYADVDHNGIFKITDKKSQVFKMVTMSGAKFKVTTFDLSGLTLEPKPED